MSASYTPDDYRRDYEAAQARFRELIESRYSTPAEAEEIAELTAYLSDYVAFGLADIYRAHETLVWLYEVQP